MKRSNRARPWRMPWLAGLALLLGLVGGLVTPTAPALAAGLTPEQAAAFVSRVYATHGALTGAGQPGVARTPALAGQTFAGPHLEALPTLVDRLHPLTGGPDATVESITLGTPQARGDASVAVPVAVVSGGTRRDLTILVTPAVDSGAPVIADVSGGSGDQRWSMRTMLGVLAQLGGVTSAQPAQPAQPAEPSRPSRSERTGQAAQPSQPAQTAEAAPAVDPAIINEMAEPTPAPASLLAAGPFLDEFEGTALAAHWNRPHPDDAAFVLDGGEVLVLATGGGPEFVDEEPTNLLRLETAEPTGDYDLSVDFKLDAKTGYESVWLGVRSGPRDHVAASLYTWTKGCGTSLYLRIRNERDLDPDGKPLRTQFTENLFDGPMADDICGGGRAYADTLLDRLKTHGARLVLRKRGPLYSAAVEMDLPAGGPRAAGPAKVETAAVARFGPVGSPALLVGQFRKAGGGETVAMVDAVRLVGPR